MMLPSHIHSFEILHEQYLLILYTPDAGFLFLESDQSVTGRDAADQPDNLTGALPGLLPGAPELNCCATGAPEIWKEQEPL